MFEVTLTEMWLFVWAVGATALYMHERDESAKHKWFARMMVEDDEMREQVVGVWKETKGKQNAT
jgi:hypothetical protein